MRRTAARQAVRMLRFMDVFSRWEASELSQLEAAELLGMGERTFRRWCRRYEEADDSACWTAGSARCRASAFRRTGARRWRHCIGRGTRASRRDTSTSIWCAITCSGGATAGRRHSCRAVICWRRHHGAVRTGGSARIVRCLG